MDSEALNEVLAALRDHDSRVEIELELTQPTAWLTDAALSSKDADLLLQEGKQLGLLTGDRGEGDGSVAWWSRACLTVGGLRRLGEWPPEGGEHLPGPWDDGVWGQRDQPLLLELDSSPPDAGFLLGPEGGDDRKGLERWQGILRLHDAGLIGGRIQQGGLDGLRITVEGRRTLDGPHGPLDRAVVELRRGAKAEAMTAVADEALASLLQRLADANGVTTNRNGKPLGLSNLAEQLLAAGAYGRDSLAEIQVCLALRNETDHGRGAQISDTRIFRAIETARELEERL